MHSGPTGIRAMPAALQILVMAGIIRSPENCEQVARHTWFGQLPLRNPVCSGVVQKYGTSCPKVAPGAKFGHHRPKLAKIGRCDLIQDAKASNEGTALGAGTRPPRPSPDGQAGVYQGCGHQPLGVPPARPPGLAQLGPLPLPLFIFLSLCPSRGGRPNEAGSRNWSPGLRTPPEEAPREGDLPK